MYLHTHPSPSMVVRCVAAFAVVSAGLVLSSCSHDDTTPTNVGGSTYIKGHMKGDDFFAKRKARRMQGGGAAPTQEQPAGGRVVPQ